MWKTPFETTSKLTLELRDVLAGGVDIWAFDYPSYYSGAEKLAFEQKVIDHYYFRQIGQETVGRFLHMFRTRIREIMPYYLEMYRSVEIMAKVEDPFGNVDIVETFEETTSGEASGQSTGTQSGSTETTEDLEATSSKSTDENKEHRFSNTPQGSVSNLDNYLTEASVDVNGMTEEIANTGSNSSKVDTSMTNGATNTSSSSGTTKHTLTRKGNQGVNTYAHDMIEFRKSIINVDMMIIDDLKDLFLQVY